MKEKDLSEKESVAFIHFVPEFILTKRFYKNFANQHNGI